MDLRMALDEVHRLATAIAADYPGVTVESIAGSDGENESVELLLIVPRGETTESQVVRVQRLDRIRFEHDLREQLQAAIAER
jgi:hypothetical protein